MHKVKMWKCKAFLESWREALLCLLRCPMSRVPLSEVPSIHGLSSELGSNARIATGCGEHHGQLQVSSCEDRSTSQKVIINIKYDNNVTFPA